MNSLDIEAKKDIYRLALFMGEIMLKNGAETYRIEDSILRMCKSRGYEYTNVFVTPTVIIVSDERFDGISFMKSIESRDINLTRIDLLNSFSREFVANKEMTLNEARKRLKKIESTVEYKKDISYIGVAFGCATYSLLLGSTINDFLYTFLVAVMTSRIYDKLSAINYMPFFSSLITSLFIALTGTVLGTLNLVQDHSMVIIGAIIPLFPGVGLVKGVRDSISGKLLSGLARSFEACMTAIAIAAGVGIALNICTVLGGVF